MAYIVAEPDFALTLDGQDLTARVRPRLISLTLTDKRDGEADQLDIVLDDSDGRLALPREGAELTLQLGWKKGSEVTVGLVDKGRFTVDEVEHGGPPDTITIRARSADFTSDIRNRREKSWRDTTLGAIVGDIASQNRLQARCAPALASIAVKTAVQSRESDIAFLRRLGRKHDAIATIKHGALIFGAKGSGLTPSGKPIPPVTIRRGEQDQHSYKVEKREEAEGVTASWHDRDAAEKKDVTIGKGKGARRLGRTYGSKKDASRAARAEQSRAARQPRKLSLTLAYGQADLYPERKAKVSGFKAEIDAISWLIVEVKHQLSNSGFTSSVEMEAV